jgi:hypothetical protein
MIDATGVFWTAKSEETLLNPAYRGQQIFEKMYDLLKESAVGSGIRNIGGFTPATKAFTRIGFESPGKTEQLFFPFTGRAVPILLNKQPKAKDRPGFNPFQGTLYKFAGAAAGVVSSTKFAFTSVAERTLIAHDNTHGLRVQLLTSAPEEAGDLCKQFVRQWGGCTIFRDTAYLQWRLFDNPHLKALVYGAYVKGQLCGWIAFALGDDGMGYLVDLIAVDEKMSQGKAADMVIALLSTAVRDLRKMGALGVRGWHVNAHPFDTLVLQAARKLGFWHLKRGHDVVILHLPASGTESPQHRFEDWYVTRIYTEGLLG